MRKILAHDMRMKKNPQTKEDTLWIFPYFHGVMRVQSQTCTPSRKFHQLVSPTPKSSICCYFLKYFVLIDFCFCFFCKKTLTLTENLLNFNGTYMDRKQPFSGYFHIFMELCGSKVKLAPPHGNFINWCHQPRNRLYAVTS